MSSRSIEESVLRIPADAGGRMPTAMTPELVEKLVGFLKMGNYLDVACRAVGVSRDTFSTWLAKARTGEEPFVSFALQVDEAMALAEVGDIALLQKAASETWNAAAWRLERRYPARWSKRERHEHTGAEGGPISSESSSSTIAVTATMTADITPGRAAEIMRELFGRVTPAGARDGDFGGVLDADGGPAPVPTTLDELLPNCLADDDDDGSI